MGAGKNKIWSSWENKGLSRHLDGNQRREHCIPETKPQPRAAALARPKGRIDRSFSTQFNSSGRIRLAGGQPPPPARPRCAPVLLSGRDDKGQATDVG